MNAVNIDDFLMERVREGDEEAFRNLVTRYQEHVLRIAYRFFGKREDAEDAAQEVFLKLFLHCGNYKGQGRFRGFLSRMTVNECLNRIRQSSHVNAVQLNEDTMVSPESFPDEIYEKEELFHILQKALDQLLFRQKLAFLMKIYGELGYEEIGESLGCSKTAVEGLVFRARQNLQKKLQPLIKEETQSTHGM